MKDKKNMKKIVSWLILIPLCMLYLLYTLLNGHSKISFVVLVIFTFITCLELAIKYFKEVYIFQNKYNVLKVLFGIFNICLMIVCFLNIVYSFRIISILFLVMSIILLCFLIGYSIFNIICMFKNKGVFYKRAFASFISLNDFVIILITLLFSL